MSVDHLWKFPDVEPKYVRLDRVRYWADKLTRWINEDPRDLYQKSNHVHKKVIREVYKNKIDGNTAMSKVFTFEHIIFRLARLYGKAGKREFEDAWMRQLTDAYERLKGYTNGKT